MNNWDQKKNSNNKWGWKPAKKTWREKDNYNRDCDRRQDCK